MIISIIVPDTTVVIDTVGYDNLDLSSLASNIKAIQFNTSTNTGHIEYDDGTANEDITSISTYQSIVNAHISQKATITTASQEKTDASTALEATYGWKRKLAYPSIGDQLDALFHAGVFDETMTATIQAVKDAHPKP